MKARTITEQEIIDVLIGNAHPELETRVKRAVRTDLTTAALYAEWSKVIPSLCEEAKDVREIGDRVTQKVVERLRKEKQNAEAAAISPQWERSEEVLQRRLSAFSFKRLQKVIGYSLPVLCVAVIIGFFFLKPSMRFEGFIAERIVKEVYRSTEAGIEKNIQEGERFAFPAKIRVGSESHAVIRLSDNTSLDIASDTIVRIEHVRLVRQESGVVWYRVVPIQTANKRGQFEVMVPQGSIFIEGTEFEVDLKEENTAVIRVEEGRVRIVPTQGGGRGATADKGDRAILNNREVVVEEVVLVDEDALSVSEAAKRDEKGDEDTSTEIVYKYSRSLLTHKSPLISFVQPQTIMLFDDFPPVVLKKSVPFTSESPLWGILDTWIDERPVEALVACDKKLDGKWRIYFDANLNGDLTDDPSFTEGIDFVPDTQFEAGTLGKDQTVWLKGPFKMSVNTREGVSSGNGAGYCLNYYNPVCLSGAVDIPTVDSKGNIDKDNALQRHFFILDIDSDGDYYDKEGALSVWGEIQEDGQCQIHALAPLGDSMVYMGRRWSLKRNLSRELLLIGRTLKSLKKDQLQVGQPLPDSTVKTIKGDQLRLAPPERGYLLLYVWSTWVSACARDAPFAFNDLYPKFKERGLEMVGISVDYREEDLLNYVHANGVEFPQVFNGANLSEGITAELGVECVPLAILVDPTGRIVSIGKSAQDIWTFLNANLPEERN